MSSNAKSQNIIFVRFDKYKSRNKKIVQKRKNAQKFSQKTHEINNNIFDTLPRKIIKFTILYEKRFQSGCDKGAFDKN